MSILKADVGVFVDRSAVHPALLSRTRELLEETRDKWEKIDCCQGKCGDDIVMIITHDKGPDSEEIHRFAWDTFEKVTEVARELGQHGAGQDLLTDAFSGNLRVMGPGYAEM